MSGRALLLTQLSQVERLLEQPHLLHDSHIISSDLDVSVRLTEIGCVFREITDIFSIRELEMLAEQANHLAQTWFAAWSPLTSEGGCDPLSLDRYNTLWVLDEAVVASALFRRLQEQYAIEQVIIFALRGEPSKIWGEVSADVVNAVWLYMAEQGGLEILQIEPATARLDLPTPHRPISILKKIVKFGVNWIANPLLWRMFLTRLHFLPAVKNVVCVGEAEAGRYHSIAANLQVHFGYGLLLMTTDHLHKASISSEVGTTVWNPMPTFMPEVAYLIYKRKMQAIYQLWIGKQKEYSGEFPEIFANQYLNFQFEWVFLTRVPRSIQAWKIATTVLRSFRPTTLVVTSFSYYYQAEILEAARQLKIRTVTLPHSGLPTEPRRTIIGDRAVVWSRDFVSLWQTTKITQDRFVVAGLPRELVYQAYNQVNVQAKTRQKNVVVLTTRLMDIVLATISLGDHRAAYSELAAIPTHLRSDVKLVFKLHPTYDYIHFYDYIQGHSTAPNAIELLRSANLQTLIQQSDVVVLVNMPTSAYLAPLLVKKPLLYIQNAQMFEMGFAFGEWSRDAVIKDTKDIWPILEKMLFDEAFRQQVLLNNEQFLQSLIGDDYQKDPSVVIAELLDNPHWQAIESV